MLSSWWGVGIDKSPSNYKCNKSYSSKCSLKKKKKRPKKRGPLTLTGEVRNNFTEDMTLDLGHEQQMSICVVKDDGNSSCWLQEARAIGEKKKLMKPHEELSI